jgi:hypothetical protein
MYGKRHSHAFTTGVSLDFVWCYLQMVGYGGRE